MRGQQPGIGQAGAAPDDGDAVTRALRDLTKGLGIRSTSLHAALGPELRALFHVPVWDDDSLRTLARVSWQLDRLITTQLLNDQLRRVARVSFNLGEPDISTLKLTERRAWLGAKKDGQSPSESQRDLRDTIVPRFAASLRSAPPPRPADIELAEYIAAETGRPVEEYLPFPMEPRPPTPVAGPGEQRQGDRHRIGLGCAGLALLAVVISVVLLAAVLQPTSGDGTGGSPTTTSTATVAPPPVSTVTEVGGNRNGSPTFKDPFHPAETGQKVPFRQEVQVSCKVRSFSMDSIGPDGYWYRIASAPWNNRYYAPAITFLNGDPVAGPYDHNFDAAVPDC